MDVKDRVGHVMAFLMADYAQMGSETICQVFSAIPCIMYWELSAQRTVQLGQSQLLLSFTFLFFSQYPREMVNISINLKKRTLSYGE